LPSFSLFLPSSSSINAEDYKKYGMIFPLVDAVAVGERGKACWTMKILMITLSEDAQVSASGSMEEEE